MKLPKFIEAESWNFDDNAMIQNYFQGDQVNLQGVTKIHQSGNRDSITALWQL